MSLVAFFFPLEIRNLKSSATQFCFFLFLILQGMSCRMVGRESLSVMGYTVPPLHRMSKTTIAAALITTTTLKMGPGPQSKRKNLLIPLGGPVAGSPCLTMPRVP